MAAQRASTKVATDTSTKNTSSPDTMGTSANPAKMSDEHKAAIALGREQARAVRAYLEALESHRPRRGRRRTEASITSRLGAIDADLAAASTLKALKLIQERRDLHDELAKLAAGPEDELALAQSGFVHHAKAYSTAHKIEYATWRETGVAAETLTAAGITRTG